MKARVIGGKAWRTVERSTLRQDNYMIRHILEGGLDKVRRERDERLDDFAVRLLQTVLVSGKMFDLLGGLLMPEDAPDAKWTESMARATADFLAELTSDEDKAAVQAALAPLLLAFFAAGMGFTKPSRTALREAQAHPGPALEQSPALSPAHPIA